MRAGNTQSRQLWRNGRLRVKIENGRVHLCNRPSEKYELDWVENFDVDIITVNAKNNRKNSADEGIFCPQTEKLQIADDQSVLLAYSDLCLFKSDHKKLKTWEEKEVERFSVKNIETIFDEANWSDDNIENILEHIPEVKDENYGK